MTRWIPVALLAAAALASNAVLAAEAGKDSKPMAGDKAMLQKPANVSVEAWAKMTDAEKQNAVAAGKAKPATDGMAKSAAPKKEKKGGC